MADWFIKAAISYFRRLVDALWDSTTYLWDDTTCFWDETGETTYYNKNDINFYSKSPIDFYSQNNPVWQTKN
jgi:hypothetical protein